VRRILSFGSDLKLEDSPQVSIVIVYSEVETRAFLVMREEDT
jgi:hypothetical protein